MQSISRNFKQNFKIIIIFVFSFIILEVFIYNKSRDYAITESEKKIENLLLMHKAIHGYVEETQKPIIYQLKKEGKLYNDFFAPELLSFTFIARGIKDEYNKQREQKNHKKIYFKLASDNPRNPINQADSRELEILKNINEKKIKELKDVIEENGTKYLYVAMPVQSNKSSCMKCHSDPKLAPQEMVNRYGDKAGFLEKEGKIRAIISIKASLEDEIKEADRLFFILSLALFMTMSTILGSVVYFISKISAKENEIESKNSELSKLNMELEEKIRIETAKLVEKEKILIQQSKMALMGEMLNAIAHQWRQPLNSMSLYFEDISLAYSLGEVDKNYINEFRKNGINTVKNMSETIDDFSSFFSPNKHVESFFVEDAIQEVLQILKSQLVHSNIKLVFDIKDKHEYGCQKNKLKHILLNILANAKDALLDKNRSELFIKVAVYRVENSINISIEDSAGGIDSSIINKIFEPYFTTKGADKGTGIGLYMSREIVENHLGGKLTVQNTEYGAKFIIKLP